MLPPSSLTQSNYRLRSHAQESADGKPKQLAISKTEDVADEMMEGNIKLTGSPSKVEQMEDSQTEQNQPLESTVPVEKEDSNTSPSEPAELNSSTVFKKLTESLISNEKSNKIMDGDKNLEKEIISCPKCGKTFEKRTQLTEHLKTYSTDQATCPICNKVLNSSNSRDRHLLTHSKERPYECKVCKLTFTTNGNMNRHFKRHKQKVKIPNEKDDNSKGRGNFSKKEEPSQAHISEEKTEFQHKNEEIDLQNNYFKSLGLHRKSPTQLNVNKELASGNQGTSGKTLPEKRKRHFMWGGSRIALDSHITQTGDSIQRKKVKEDTDVGNSKVSSNLINFSSGSTPNNEATDAQDLAGITDIISNVQPKTSAENHTVSSSSAEHHYIRYSDKQSFACESCKYETKDKNSLKRHQQTHKRNGKFKCKICGLTFTNKANGQRHVRELHGLHDRESISDQIVFLKEENDSGDDKTFTCKYCRCIFDNEQALQHHLRSNECKMKPYYCAICDIGSSTKNNCFRHIENKHPEIFTNEMTSEDKNRIKELNMRQTLYTSRQNEIISQHNPIEINNPQSTQNEDRGFEIEVAKTLTTLIDLPPPNDTRDVIRNAETPSAAVGTDTTVTVGVDSGRTGPSKTIGTVSSVTVGADQIVTDPSKPIETISSEISLDSLGTSLSIILNASSPVTKNNSEILEDQPLDLSLNPLDLTLKSFEKSDDLDLHKNNSELSRLNESHLAVSDSNGDSAQNFANNDNNLLQKCVTTKQVIKNFKCRHCEKSFSTNSNLQRHLINQHKQSSIIQSETPRNPIRRDLLRECSINSSINHFECNEVKNSRSNLMNSKNASYDRGNGSDTENDLASIPSIQSTVNQGIHIAHPNSPNVYSVIPHINRKRQFADLQISDSSFPAWNQRKKQARIGPRSPTEAACSPVSAPQRIITANEEASIAGNPATNTSVNELSIPNCNQNFNASLAESAEISASKDTDLICRYCSSQFSSKEHVNSHIKELHYLEHNNGVEVPDEKIRWKKERFSKLRQ